MRMIDADALIDDMVDYVVDEYADSCIDFESYTKMVQTAPTIDAVSVVRCRECKYAHLTYDGDCKYCDMWKDDDGNCLELYLDGDYYCADGERKE